MARRRICFVTGSRAEFGLMRTTLEAICAHPRLTLQLIVTGMHVQPEHGLTIQSIKREGWKIDAIIAWPTTSTKAALAAATGGAMAALSEAYAALKSDVVFVVGDRVEAFAAASAAHVGGRIVAHVHGGDRALGQIDDSLRHAITKLSHIHFAATAQSAARIRRLGEDSWRVHRVGAPGIDGIDKAAATRKQIVDDSSYATLKRRQYALVSLHPDSADAKQQCHQTGLLIDAIRSSGIAQAVLIHPNNDPGWRRIAQTMKPAAERYNWIFKIDIPRPIFLGLLRDAAFLIGNSSSGIIEAGSFGTPVIDVGPRQSGREHGGNVRHVDFQANALRKVIAAAWRDGHPVRYKRGNPYSRHGTGTRIADALAAVSLDGGIREKLIAY